MGIGHGKAAEIPEAIRKATEDAKRNLVKIPIVGTTIPHEVKGRFGKGLVLLLPAEEGTGVIAGGPVRAVLEMAGVKDVRTKSYGSNNPANCAKATLQGLTSCGAPRWSPGCVASPWRRSWANRRVPLCLRLK